jgi:SAM-dependent methyltransferase
MFENQKSTDKTWEFYGKTDPYFGVLTSEQFRTSNLTEGNRQAFFETGEKYVSFIFDVIHELVPAPFRPRSALDFGCGVGRVTLPVARRADSAVGVDVSESMLVQARANARQQGLENVSFVRGDDDLSGVTGRYDFIHSFIVFQHIPRKRGETIVKRLVELLEDDGIGVLQFTYSFASSTPLSRKLLISAYKNLPPVYWLRNLVKGIPMREPMMQMNEYDLNRLLRILEEAGCHRVQIRFTETGHFGQPFYGAMLFFQKRRTDVRAHS